MYSFIHSLVDNYLGCFHFLFITNNTVMNACVQVFAWAFVFISPKYLPTSGIAGSYGHCTFIFFEELPDCSPKWLYRFVFLLAVY